MITLSLANNSKPKDGNFFNYRVNMLNFRITKRLTDFCKAIESIKRKQIEKDFLKGDDNKNPLISLRNIQTI